MQTQLLAAVKARQSRIAAAHYKHGQSTKAARNEYLKDSAALNQLEDAMYILKITTAPRTRGRKPKGHKQLCSIQDVILAFPQFSRHSS